MTRDTRIGIHSEYLLPLRLRPMVARVHLVFLVAGLGLTFLFNTAFGMALAPTLGLWALLILFHIGVRIAVRRCERAVHVEPCDNTTDPKSRRLQIFVDRDTVAQLQERNVEFGDPAIFKRQPYLDAGTVAVAFFLGMLINRGNWNFDKALWCVCLAGGFVAAGFKARSILGMYYRVVPGRLDVLRSQTGSAKMMRTDTVDLRHARIKCLGTGLVMLTRRHGERSQKHVIDLREIDRPLELLAAVICAAETERETPNIPDEDLLG